MRTWTILGVVACVAGTAALAFAGGGFEDVPQVQIQVQVDEPSGGPGLVDLLLVGIPAAAGIAVAWIARKRWRG